jgi:hypothetical protein
VIALLVMIVFSAAAIFFTSGSFLKKPIFFSWLVNGINAYLSAQICRQAIGRGLKGFMFWALIANSIRVALFFLVLAALIWFEILHYQAYLVGLLVGYFCCLAGEVLALHSLSTKGFK